MSAVATSNTVLVTVHGALSVSNSPTSVILDVGQSQMFAATVTGGTSTFSYQWYLDGVAVSGATNSSWTYTPSAAGSHTVYVKVTDSVSAVGTSNIATVSVGGSLSVSVSPISVILDVGQSQLFTSSISGGTSSYSYQWYLDGVAISGATSTAWTCTPSVAGPHTVCVKVTDSASTPVTATSNNASVTANAALSVTISPTIVVLDVGLSQVFTSAVPGGTSPYSYQWYLNGALVSGATSTTWTFMPLSIGSYSVCVKVNDTIGTTATSNTSNVTVTLPHVPMPIEGSVGITGYKLMFEEIMNNSLSSSTSIDYYWSFNAYMWNGTQWVAAGISGSTALVTGYPIPSNTTVNLPYSVYLLSLSAVNWGDWLRISYSFHWTYSSTAYSVAYVAKLNVHPADVAGAASVTFPYFGAIGIAGTASLHLIGVCWGNSSVGLDPTSYVARADIGGYGSVGTADLHILGVEWDLTWTNTPPPG
jgi:hypothetical protein